MGRPFSFTDSTVTGGVFDGTFSITAPYWERRGTAELPYFHQGVDVGCPMRTPLYAPYSCTVGYLTRVGDGNALTPIYGNSTWLNVNGGGSFFTAHLDEISVNVGDVLAEGDPIGYSGTTGQSTGPHVHLQCSLGSTEVLVIETVDPLAFMTMVASRGTTAPAPTLTTKDYALKIRDYATEGVPSLALVAMLDELAGRL